MPRQFQETSCSAEMWWCSQAYLYSIHCDPLSSSEVYGSWVTMTWPVTHVTHRKKWPIWPIDPWPIDPLPALVTETDVLARVMHLYVGHLLHLHAVREVISAEMTDKNIKYFTYVHATLKRNVCRHSVMWRNRPIVNLKQLLSIKLIISVTEW